MTQDFKITVIDNGSTDSSIDNISDSVKVVTLGKNYGFSNFGKLSRTVTGAFELLAESLSCFVNKKILRLRASSVFLPVFFLPFTHKINDK